jgi:hypothetical protein
VSRTRVPENLTPEALRQCPRLAKAALGKDCREERFAGNKEALLFNKSF